MSIKVIFAADMDDAMGELEPYMPDFKGSSYCINHDGSLTLRNDVGRAMHFTARAWLAVVDE